MVETRHGVSILRSNIKKENTKNDQRPTNHDFFGHAPANEHFHHQGIFIRQGRAIRCNRCLVPRQRISASIPHAGIGKAWRFG